MARPRTFDKEEMLDKALGIFWEKGYQATSINDLETALGIKRTSIYAAYGSKLNLYFSALNKYKLQGKDFRTQISLKEDNPLIQIQSFIFQSIEMANQDDGNKSCFMVNSCTEMKGSCPNVDQLIESNFKDVINYFKSRLALAQKQMLINTSINIKNEAHHLYALLTGTLIMLKSGAKVNTLKSLVKHHLTSLH